MPPVLGAGSGALDSGSGAVGADSGPAPAGGAFGGEAGAATVVDARLVACPACGGANAASRQFCGRCGVVIGQGAPPGAGPVSPVGHDAPAAALPGRAGMPATLVVVTVFAGLVVTGVLFTILSARGTWPFAGQAEETPPELVPVAVRSASASSEVPGSGRAAFGAGNVADGDSDSAWMEGVAGSGAGEWVELRLARDVPVVRLLVWNGYQREGRFPEHNRVARARVQVGERTFTADLLDVAGPQAVDLPEPVRADRVRFEILDVHPGTRYEDTAVSRLEVFAAPGSDP